MKNRLKILERARQECLVLYEETKKTPWLQLAKELERRIGNLIVEESAKIRYVSNEL